MHSTPERRGKDRGFTLVETLVALLVVAIAVTMLAALVGNEPRALRRLEAHREAWQALGGGLETLRTTLAAPSSGTFDPAPLLGPSPTAEGMAVEVTANGAGRPGLFTVRLTARYTVAGRAYERTVESLIWRPPG